MVFFTLLRVFTNFYGRMYIDVGTIRSGNQFDLAKFKTLWQSIRSGKIYNALAINSIWKNLKCSGHPIRSGNQFKLEKFKTLWQSNSLLAIEFIPGVFIFERSLSMDLAVCWQFVPSVFIFI
jgi:hypothetical protein